MELESEERERLLAGDTDLQRTEEPWEEPRLWGIITRTLGRQASELSWGQVTESPKCHGLAWESDDLSSDLSSNTYWLCEPEQVM